jgi:hypothetical protein
MAPPCVKVKVSPVPLPRNDDESREKEQCDRDEGEPREGYNNSGGQKWAALVQFAVVIS